MNENHKNEPVTVTPVREPAGMAALFAQPHPQTRPPHQPPAPPLGLGDIYYILFRQKWLILACSVAGIVAAGMFYVSNPPLYFSQAKLFVRYVVEAKSLTLGREGQLRSTDGSGESIVNSEIEILTSRDLADQVVTALGPEKILAKLGGSNDLVRAASVVQAGLRVEAPRKSNVIHVGFEHPDPAVTQPVLRQLITAYIARHLQVHAGVGVFDQYLTKQRDRLRLDLNDTEQELRKLKQQLGVLSIEDTRRNYDQQLGNLRQDIFTVEVEILERKTALKLMGGIASNPADTNAPPVPKAPPDKVQQHRRLVSQLDNLGKREAELLLQFTPEGQRIKDVRQQMATLEQEKAQLEEEHPTLIGIPAAATSASGRSYSTADTFADTIRLAGLEMRLQALTNRLETMRGEVAVIDQAEARLVDLQRRRDLLDRQYLAYASGLEQTLISETLGTGKIPNISEVQEPTPPTRQISKLAKPMAGMLGGGIGLGLALAFLVERVLRQSIRLPSDVEKHLRLPVFLAIPSTDQARRRAKALRSTNGKPKAAADSAGSPPPDLSPAVSPGRIEIAPWDANHPLRMYYEALRDRLVTYFEVRNMTHRPKLVALSSCHRKAGVSSIATGLAAVLSETGDGKVLLVDMNLEQGDAHRFSAGRPDCGLADALEAEKRETAQVQENLYLATEGNGNGHANLPRALPKRFLHLVPKLKASDYDYIIFDMPPVDQTSVTPRLAGYMDMLLFVVEPERTNREAARLATAMLHESRANVAAIVNKQRSYIPKWVHHEW